MVIHNNSEEKIIYFALQHFETRKFRLFDFFSCYTLLIIFTWKIKGAL